MTAVYTYLEAQQNFDALLEQVSSEGSVHIKNENGQVFVVQLAQKTASPLDVDGVNLALGSAEIVASVHEARHFQ